MQGPQHWKQGQGTGLALLLENDGNTKRAGNGRDQQTEDGLERGRSDRTMVLVGEWQKEENPGKGKRTLLILVIWAKCLL